MAERDVERCGQCFKPIGVVWAAEHALFNEVNGSPNGMWCIPCFDAECEKRGVLLRWVPEQL